MAKKRANGEGSIRKKPNGRWEGRYTLGIDPATGRAVQKSVSAKTRAECKEKLDRAIRDNRGIPMDHNEDYTVAEWCRLWFETYSKPVIRPNTAKNYRNKVTNPLAQTSSPGLLAPFPDLFVAQSLSRIDAFSA